MNVAVIGAGYVGLVTLNLTPKSRESQISLSSLHINLWHNRRYD